MLHVSYRRFEPADNVLVDRPGRATLRVPTVPSLDRIATMVAVRRWQAYAGKSAVLAGSGETFETTESRRITKPAAA